jgi:Domain of unknown function (DUF4440)
METNQELIRLNIKIGESEKDKDLAFFENYLSDELLFVRASGKTNSKNEFIEALKNPNLMYRQIDTQVVKVIVTNDGKKAFVKAIVKAIINNEGKETNGFYINNRFFELKGKGWILTNWHNYEL